MDEKSIQVLLKGGSKTGEILKELKKMRADSYSDLYVHVGTNDCSTKFPEDKLLKISNK